MENDKIEITKIRLQLKDREIELTSDEAHQVSKELNKLFELEKTELQKLKEKWEKREPQKEYIPYPIPSYPYPNPIYIQPYWPSYPNWGIPMCGSGNTMGQSTGTLFMNITGELS